MPYHMELPSSSCHEDKLIIDAQTSDAGKVTTPSSTTAGKGELRKLFPYELNWGLTIDTAGNGKVFTPSSTDNNRIVLEYPKYTKLDATGLCTTTDVGKVLTPSSSDDGKLVLRALKHSDLDESENVEFSAIRIVNDTYAITAAIDATLNTASDFVPWPFGLDVEEAENCSYNATTKTLTISNTATLYSNYLLISNITVSASTVNTKVAFAYKVNGVLVAKRFIVRGNAAGDFMVGSRVRMLNLAPGDTLQLCVACDKTCTLTLQDFSAALIIN